MAKENFMKVIADVKEANSVQRHTKNEMIQSSRFHFNVYRYMYTYTDKGAALNLPFCLVELISEL